MKSAFAENLTLLRSEKGVSQSLAASSLGISQSLLSHYEQGIREPGLSFVSRACSYYGVSADFLLGRTDSRWGDPELIAAYRAAESAAGSGGDRDPGTLYSRLLSDSISLLFRRLSAADSSAAVQAAAEYLCDAFYRIFRQTCQAGGGPDGGLSGQLSRRHFESGLPEADMKLAETSLADALDSLPEGAASALDMSPAALEKACPDLYQSLVQLLTATEERISSLTGIR